MLFGRKLPIFPEFLGKKDTIAKNFHIPSFPSPQGGDFYELKVFPSPSTGEGRVGVITLPFLPSRRGRGTFALSLSDITPLDGVRATISEIVTLWESVW